MRLVMVVAATAVLAAPAWAQDSTPPPSDVAASACAAFVQAPAPPDGATATADQMREAVTGFETWRTQTQATLDCRSAEVRTLNAQLGARTGEFRAAQADNTERAATFQAQLDIFQARQRR